MQCSEGSAFIFTEGGGNLGEVEEGAGRCVEGVEVFEVGRHVEDFPIPEGSEGEAVSDSGFRFGGGFGEADGAADRAGDRDTVEDRGLENHGVYECSEFGVNIKSLGIHIDLIFIFSLEFEVVSDFRGKVFPVAVIVGDTNFVQEYARARGRDEFAEVFYIEDTDTGENTVFHIGIDSPSPFLVLFHFTNHGGGFKSTLFT